MKLTVKTILVLALAGVLMTYSGCNKPKHGPEPITDQQIDKLNDAWKVNTVTLDGVDQTSNYTGFILTLAGVHGATTLNYTTTDRPASPMTSPWPASGTFAFVTGTPQSELTRDDLGPTVIFNYVVSSTSLSVTFQFSGVGYTNRVSNVDGLWVFTFTH